MGLPFGFEADEELTGGHCSRIYGSRDRILKVPFQGEELVTGCLSALRLEEIGGPKVFEVDESTGSVLMERMIPGTSLAESGLNEFEIREIIVDFANRVRQLPIESTICLSDYYSTQTEGITELIDSSEERCFLHGDLHPYNVLLHGNQWRIIDAKALSGDPAFEPVAFLRNLLPKTKSDIYKLTEERIQYFSKELGVNRERVLKWAIVDCENDVDLNRNYYDSLKELAAQT